MGASVGRRALGVSLRRGLAARARTIPAGHRAVRLGLVRADGRAWTPAGGDGYDAFSASPRGDVGWATGAGGRIARVTLAR